MEKETPIKGARAMIIVLIILILILMNCAGDRLDDSMNWDAFRKSVTGKSRYKIDRSKFKIVDGELKRL